MNGSRRPHAGGHPCPGIDRPPIRGVSIPCSTSREHQRLPGSRSTKSPRPRASPPRPRRRQVHNPRAQGLHRRLIVTVPAGTNRNLRESGEPTPAAAGIRGLAFAPGAVLQAPRCGPSGRYVRNRAVSLLRLAPRPEGHLAGVGTEATLCRVSFHRRADHDDRREVGPPADDRRSDRPRHATMRARTGRIPSAGRAEPT